MNKHIYSYFDDFLPGENTLEHYFSIPNQRIKEIRSNISLKSRRSVELAKW